MLSERHPKFDGINDAREFLGVDRSATRDEIESAYQSATNDADERVAVEAREMALTDSRNTGYIIATILSEDIKPDDITSVLDAQRSFVAAPPPQNESGLGSYHKGIKRTADGAIERLNELRDAGEDISDENIQAVRVGEYILRYRDVEEGKRYVLGEDAADYKDAWRGSLSPTWKYSVHTADGTESYVHGEKRIEIRPIDNESVAYSVNYILDGDNINKKFHRYGEAKQKVKQWIISPPDI